VITSKGIEAFLMRHPYKSVKVPETEETVSGTIMAEIFEEQTKRGIIPSQFRFAHLVNERNKLLFFRPARAWASFLMEYHLYCLLRENGIDVTYNLNEDFEKGVDFTIWVCGKTAKLHAYYSTKSAEEWARIKRENRHKNEEIIEFPLYKEEARVVGNVHLYTLEHVRMLVRRFCP
jgi:hypothetical protein